MSTCTKPQPLTLHHLLQDVIHGLPRSLSLSVEAKAGCISSISPSVRRTHHPVNRRLCIGWIAVLISPIIERESFRRVLSPDACILIRLHQLDDLFSMQTRLIKWKGWAFPSYYWATLCGCVSEMPLFQCGGKHHRFCK